MYVNIPIERISILKGFGTDIVCLHTMQPSAVWPFDKEYNTLKFEAASGTGVEYCREQFRGISITVIEDRLLVSPKAKTTITVNGMDMDMRENRE